MPLYKSIAVDKETHILVWEITETEEQLKTAINFTANSEKRLASMQSQMHRKGYLSVRQLLKIAQYTDDDLTYGSFGKPFLSDGVQVSITHSHQYAAVIFGAQPVGIDIEKQRSKINGIASKFISEKEEEYLSQYAEPTAQLTFIWCIKEAIYKLYGKKGLSFKNHIDVAPFELNFLHTKACVNYKAQTNFYEVNGFTFNEFTCAYVH